MSHIFEIYPGSSKLPTFAQIVDTAEKRVHERMGEIGIDTEIKLRVTLRMQEGEASIVEAAEGLFQWPAGPGTYAWFEVAGIDGGCDVTYSEDRSEIDIIRDEIKYSRRLSDEFVDQCLDFGRRWAFRRSAGQSCTIALVYGYVAAALAELTEGFIYSDDGAWDRDMLPMQALEFYSTFFRPEKTREHLEWTNRCLKQIPAELHARAVPKLDPA